MEQEQQFVATLAEVKKLAKKQGNRVSEEQVKNAFSELDFDETQFKMISDYLRSQKIGIGESTDPDAWLSEAERNYLAAWLESIRTQEELSSGEKEAVILSAMAGDAQAKEQLIRLFLPHVADMARLYAGQGALLEDLIGEGNLALARGVEMLGTAEDAAQAEGLLGSMIMESMEEHIAENAREKEAGERTAQKVNQVADAARELAESLGRKVSMQELADETEMTLLEIMEAVKFSGDAIEDIDTGENGRG